MILKQRLKLCSRALADTVRFTDFFIFLFIFSEAPSEQIPLKHTVL